MKKIMCAVLIAMLMTGVAWAGGQKEAQKTEVKVIRFYAGQYTPEEPTAENPNPPTYLEKIVAEYESLHPDVKIELVPNTNQTSTAFDQWKYTQFVSESIPDIIYNNPQLANNEQASKQWYIALDDYMMEPNPYVEGNQKWVDVLAPGVYDSSLATDKKHYNLSLDAIDTAIFYNKDAFKAAGISGTPETWSEFIDACEKLKAAGYTPFGFAMGADGRDYTDWFERQMLDMLYADMAQQLKALPGDVEGRTEYAITKEQFVRAIKTGMFSAQDPRYKRMLDIYKGFSKYWQQGYAGTKAGDLSQLFVKGSVAMFQGMSGDVKNFEERIKPDFEWGTFQAIPLIDGAEGTGRIGIIGAFANYNITNMAEKRGNLEEAVDFLKFLSAPQNCGPMINELGYFIPMVNDVQMPEGLEIFVPSVSRRDTLFYGFVSRLTPQFGDEYYKVLQSYMLDSISSDEAAEKIQKLMDSAADQLIKENGWSL